MHHKVDINTVLTSSDASCQRRDLCPTRTTELLQVVGFGTNYTRYWKNEREGKRDIKGNL
jgi:hypothetical protein